MEFFSKPILRYQVKSRARKGKEINSSIRCLIRKIARKKDEQRA